MARVVALAAFVLGAPVGVAAAQERADRAGADIAPAYSVPADPEAGLSFDTSAHRGWYRVFWSGACDSLPFLDRMICVKGRPTWAGITRMVLAKAPPGGHARLRAKMILLGRMIGYEWARPNDDRRIDNDDLERWSAWLNKSIDVNDAVERMAKAARIRIGRP